MPSLTSSRNSSSLPDSSSFPVPDEHGSFAVTAECKEAEAPCSSSSLPAKARREHTPHMKPTEVGGDEQLHDESSISLVAPLSRSSSAVAVRARKDRGGGAKDQHIHPNTSPDVRHPRKKTSLSSPSSPRSSSRSALGASSSSSSSVRRESSLDFKTPLEHRREVDRERGYSKNSGSYPTPSSFFFWKWGGGGGSAADRAEDKKKTGNPVSSFSSHAGPSESSRNSQDVLEWSRSESLPASSSFSFLRERGGGLDRKDVSLRGAKEVDDDDERTEDSNLHRKFSQDSADAKMKPNEGEGGFLGFPKKSMSTHSHHGAKNSSFVMAQAKKFKKMTVAFMMQGGKRLSSAPSSSSHSQGQEARRKNSTSSDRARHAAEKEKKKKRDVRRDVEGGTRKPSDHKEEREVSIFTDRLVGEDALTRHSLDLTGWIYPSSSLSSGRYSQMW